jgi:hypothetical protein
MVFTTDKDCDIIMVKECIVPFSILSQPFSETMEQRNKYIKKIFEMNQETISILTE